MSCIFCNLKKGPFKTEEIYLKFANRIHVLIKEDILIKLGEIKPKSPFIELQYKCIKCGQSWVLKISDQAFREGWYENKK